MEGHRWLFGVRIGLGGVRIGLGGVRTLGASYRERQIEQLFRAHQSDI